MAIELKTTDAAGQAVGSVTLDEQAFGGFVKNRLIHSASVMYHNNTRQGSACTKTRAAIAGSTKKLYRQKGTGRARAGTKKGGVRKGGGVIHGPQPRNFVFHMPKKQRQAALRSTLLGKAKDGELHVIAGLDFEAPKTKNVVALIEGHGLTGKSVLIATDGLKRNVYLSGRNIPKVRIIPAQELNAREALLHTHLIIEQSAFERLNTKPEQPKRARKPKGTRKDSASSKTES